MEIAVFGSGYVGLVQAAVLAEIGHQVVCVDVDEKRVAELKRGIIPIYEPGLELLIQQNSSAGRLMFTLNAHQAVQQSAIQFIAVGTPMAEGGRADLTAVFAVARTIAESMNNRKVVINKSTVPVGTAEKVEGIIRDGLSKRGTLIPFDVVSNPEFLKEGAALADCMRPERIIIGSDSQYARTLMSELYAPFNRNHDRIMFMGQRSAELTKYAANCMLATKISFMNEMANLADKLGADIEKVRLGIGADPRIGYHFIYPGCGYGGSCFPKDIQALISTAEDVGYPTPLLRAVEQVNQRQKQKLFAKIVEHFGPQLEGRTFAIWGLSFKPNTNDVRAAPSLTLMEALWQAGASVRAFDPQAIEEVRHLYGARVDFQLVESKEEALYGADGLVICTEWRNFRSPDFNLLRKKMRYPVIFDGRNLYDPERLSELGFTYYSIGRGCAATRAENPVVLPTFPGYT